MGYVTDSRNEVVKSDFGLCWRTSYWTPAMAIAECDPDLVAATAAPQKVAEKVAGVAPAPIPASIPAMQRVKLDADTLFDFDQANLRPAGRQALDEFIVKMRGITPEVILAVGHADRLGADNYNQRLSERRVETVKAYLVDKGVDQNRIKVEGKGKTQPITKQGDCEGRKSAKVIACLQPDRRVEIEVIGTQRAK